MPGKERQYLVGFCFNVLAVLAHVEGQPVAPIHLAKGRNMFLTSTGTPADSGMHGVLTLFHLPLSATHSFCDMPRRVLHSSAMYDVKGGEKEASTVVVVVVVVVKKAAAATATAATVSFILFGE